MIKPVFFLNLKPEISYLGYSNIKQIVGLKIDIHNIVRVLKKYQNNVTNPISMVESSSGFSN